MSQVGFQYWYGFPLLFVTSFSIKALRLSLSAALLTQALPLWRVIDQRKLISQLWLVCFVGSQMAFPTVLYINWLMQASCHRREMRQGHVVQLKLTLLKLSSGWGLLQCDVPGGRCRVHLFASLSGYWSFYSTSCFTPRPWCLRRCLRRQFRVGMLR